MVTIIILIIIIKKKKKKIKNKKLKLTNNIFLHIHPIISIYIIIYL